MNDCVTVNTSDAQLKVYYIDSRRSGRRRDRIGEQPDRENYSTKSDEREGERETKGWEGEEKQHGEKQHRWINIHISTD